MNEIKAYSLRIEKQYEKDFGEPWSELEKGVRERHPEVFIMLDSMKE